MKIVFLLSFLLAALLIGCGADTEVVFPTPPPSDPQTVMLDTQFNNGAQSWLHGISDLPPGSEEEFQFSAALSTLPTDPARQGYRLSSHNHSDDVFMFLKRNISGLEPNYDYRLSGEITFLSNAGIGCFGIGGSPGEGVYIKLGAHQLEPIQADYYLNLDIGAQANSGNDAVVIGDAATEGIACANSESFGSKTLSLDSTANFVFTSSPEGDAWVLVGSDSGFEGVSTFYYTSINLTLTPVSP